MDLALNKQRKADCPEESDVTLGWQKKTLPLPIVLYFIALLLPFQFKIGALHLTSIRALLFVLIIPLIINLVGGKYGKILWTDILLFLHLAWIGVALAVNSPEKTVSQVGSLGIEFLGGYLLGRAYIRNRSDMVAVINALLLVTLVTLPFAIYETITGNPIIIEAINRIPGVAKFPVASLEKRLGLERVQVMMAHPIHYGMLVSASFSLVFVGLRGIIGDKNRYVATFTILLCVIMSLSSGALLSVIFQMFLIFWAWSFRKIKYRWLILFFLFLAMYVAVDLSSNRTPIRVFMHYATFSAHNAYWRGIIFDWGMINVWINPVFGLGLNDWVRPHYMNSGSMDNFWLVMAVRYGIPGFALLALGYLLALWRIGRRNFENDQLLWQLRRGWMFTFVGLTFTLCTVHIWASVYSVTFFIFGAGIWLITAESNTTKRAPLVDLGSRIGLEFSRNLMTKSKHPSDTIRSDLFEKNSNSDSTGEASMRREKIPTYSRFPSSNTRNNK